MIGGVAEEVQRLVNRLQNNIHVGYDTPEKGETEAPRVRRNGIDGYMEDTFDQLSAIRESLQSLIVFVGQCGNGGVTGYPTSANLAKGEPVTGTRRW